MLENSGASNWSSSLMIQNISPSKKDISSNSDVSTTFSTEVTGHFFDDCFLHHVWKTTWLETRSGKTAARIRIFPLRASKTPAKKWTRPLLLSTAQVRSKIWCSRTLRASNQNFSNCLQQLACFRLYRNRSLQVNTKIHFPLCSAHSREYSIAISMFLQDWLTLHL